MQSEQTNPSAEARPFLRSADGNFDLQSGDSDSASCGSGDSESGSGAGSCAHVPLEPPVEP